MFEQLNFGGVGEWLKPAVLKTVRPQKGLVGSNPTPSASQSDLFSLFPFLLRKLLFSGPFSLELLTRSSLFLMALG
jgi:hypothetical protein